MEKRDLEMKLDSCHPSTALLCPTFLPSQLQEPAILSLCFASGGVTQSPADGQAEARINPATSRASC